MKKSERIVGTQKFVNPDTGEYTTMQIVEKDEYEKDSNFYKLFLNDFLSALELVANQKTKLLCWILKNITRDNRLHFTYRQIADKTGISYATVADTMQILLDADFMRRNNTGYYMINPNVIFKGSYQRRCIAIKNYMDGERGKSINADEKRLSDITKEISRLQRQAQHLQKNLDIQKSENI